MYFNFEYNINISDLNSVFYGLDNLFEYLSVFYNSNDLLLGLPMESLNTPENTPEEIIYNSSSTGSNNNSSGSNSNSSGSNSNSSDSNTNRGDVMDIDNILNPESPNPESPNPETPNQGNGDPSEHPQTPSGQVGNDEFVVSDADSNGYYDEYGHCQWYYTPTPPGGHSPGHQTFWERINNPRPSPSGSPDESRFFPRDSGGPSNPDNGEGSSNPGNGEGSSNPDNGEGSSGSKRPDDGSGEGSSGSKKRPHDGSGEGSSGSKRPRT